MSNLRRAKTFYIAKNYSSDNAQVKTSSKKSNKSVKDYLNVENNNATGTNVRRTASFTTYRKPYTSGKDSLPFLDELEMKIRHRRSSYETDTNLKPSQLRKKLTKRLSMSLDSVMQKELLKNVRASNCKADDEDRDVFSPRFPVGDDEPAIRGPRQTISRPKTLDFGSMGKRTGDFEIFGVIKIKEAQSKEMKLKNKERILFQSNGLILAIGDRGHMQKLIEPQGIKHIKQSSRTTVEIHDKFNGICTLTFASLKNLKDFLENENIRKFTDKSLIRGTLLNWFKKRPSRDDLMKKGIYQYETIFDNSLINVYINANNGVPKFITNIIELIELPDNIQSVGLYRTSGNLAVIQKIRTEVDKGQLDILQQHANDVDVLTGCLKLFFRELKEPLFPYDVVDGILSICRNFAPPTTQTDTDKIITMIKRLPEAHLQIMFVLFDHLLAVVKHKEENKMDIYNLSVCWGPTLVFFKQPCKDLVSQSADATKFIELLLTFYRDNRDHMEKFKRKQSLVKADSPFRYNSKESIHKRSTNNISDNSYEIVKKLTELIRQGVIAEQLNIEGLYKKSGSTEKITKILKKINKNRLGELDKFKTDVHDLAGALKKYLRELQEPLLPKDILQSCCDKNFEQIQFELEKNPKKESLNCLLDHINFLLKIENNHKIPRKDMIFIWANVLNIKQDGKITQKLAQLLEILLNGSDDRNSINSINNMNFDNERLSHYDNLPSPIKTKIDVNNALMKTESTKL